MNTTEQENYKYPLSIGYLETIPSVIRKNNLKNSSVILIEQGRGSKRVLQKLEERVTVYLKSKININFIIEIESGREAVFTVEFSNHFTASEMSGISDDIEKFIGSEFAYSSMSI